MAAYGYESNETDATDETDAKDQREDAPQQAQDQLTAIFDTMIDGVFVFNEHERLIRTNAAGRALLGGDELYRSPSTSLREGAERFRLRDPQGLPLNEQQWPVHRLLQGEEFKGTHALEVLVHTLTGEERFLSLSGTPVRNSRGKITGAIIIARDITQHERMEQALRQQEEQYRTIVQTANEGIWLLNPRASTLYANERMSAMLGYSSEELLERTLLDCVFPEDVAGARMRLESSLQGQREQFELRFRRRDGSPLDTLASTTPVYATDGSITGSLGLFTDITARKHVEEALRQSEEMLHLALRNAPIAIFRQDKDLRYTWMYNPPSSTPEIIVGKSDADFVSPELASHLARIKRHVLTSGESIREEVRVVSEHGERFELLALEPLRRSDGRVVGLTGTSINITAQKQLELRTHRALEALLAMAEVIVQRTRLDQQPLTALRSMAQEIALLTRNVLGCERLSLHQIERDTERILPLAVVGLSDEMESAWWADQQQNIAPFSARFGEDLEARLRQREIVILDMTRPPYSVYPNPYGVRSMLIVPLGLNEGLLGLLELDYRGADHVYSDDEIALAEAAGRLLALVIEREQLLVSNQHLNDLVELAHDAVIVRDAESHIQFWNQGAEQLYGWSKEEALHQITHTLLATHFPISLAAIDSYLSEHGQWEGILQHTRRDGAQLTVESRQVLVRDAAGDPSAVLEINRDITERERLAQERIEAQANERALRESNQLMDEFIGIAGHELRTPLTTVKASVQLAHRQIKRILTQEMPLTAIMSQLTLVQGHLNRTERQIAMQNRLISDLLDVSRIHAERLELHPDLCDLAMLVREVVEDQQYLTPERRLELSIQPAGEILVLADADRMRQVISNYLSNALKYSEASKPVTVRVEAAATSVRVSVRDEGPGLSLEQQQRVWERFYRVPGVEVKTGSGIGLGLGLHISKMIIERQRGQVGIESTPGAGSTFWLTLPLAELS